MDVNHPQGCNSLLEEVKPYIPSMDTAEPDKGDINIFQRPAGFSLKVPEKIRYSVEDFKPEVDDNKSNKPDGDAKSRAPVLSFARLDRWDLDNVLKNLTQDRLSTLQSVSSKTEKSYAIHNNQSETNNMERLVAFCENQQASQSVKNVSCVRHNVVRNKSLERGAELKLIHQERPTVFIDLRYPDASVKPAKTAPTLSSEPKLSDKLSTGEEIPPVSDQQTQHKMALCHHEQDQEILKQLESDCPSNSINLKESAAEGTDVLHEFEATHLESFSTLPADLDSKGCVLLTVRLSSPGMVSGMDAAQGKRKHSPATKSHIYNTLVAWFLSLVGPYSCHIEGNVGTKVPFWVVGLQQLWTKNGLALQVLAVAYRCFTPKKKEMDIFYNDVFSFLSETSLSSVADWLPQLKGLLDQHDFASPVLLPPSCLNSFISVTSSKKVIDRTFGLSPGFYWQTVNTQEPVFKGARTTQELHTEVSAAVGRGAFFRHPAITHYTLQLIHDSGLDVCGLRLLYPPQGILGESGDAPVNQRVDEPCQSVLALAVRGPHAHSVFKTLIGFIHPLLHKKTGITSVSLLDCKYQEPPFVHSPQLTNQVHRELRFWFSGRRQAGSTQNHNQHQNRNEPSNDKVCQFNLSSSSSLLCASTKADLLLVVSPAVPPRCYGMVLAVCERRGFSLMGLQRLQLQDNKAAVLGLTSQQVTVFCSPPSTLHHLSVELPSQCLVLLLQKENMLRHSITLPSALMREFKAQKLLGCLHTWQDGAPVEPRLYFHTVPCSNSLFRSFAQHMWAVPSPSSVILSHQRSPSQSDVEQVILSLHGKDMSANLDFLHTILTDGPRGEEYQAGFELLGLKWLPELTRYQAQELSPHEVGEKHYCSSVDNLMLSPALVCALRGKDAFSSIKNLLLLRNPPNLSVLMSPTPEVALRQASLFFSENDLVHDQQKLFTVCLLRPRVWNNDLTKIICKLQQNGLVMVGLQVVNPDKSYPACFGSLAICLQGESAVKRVLDMLRKEDASLWLTCHGSGSYQQAVKDVKRFFPEGLCCAETSTMRQEQIQTLCSDPFASVERKQNCFLNVAPEDLAALAASGPNEESLIHGALGQTTCLLMPLNAPPHCQLPSQLEMLEQLLRSGCHLVAGRMSILDSEQRKRITEILTVSSGREKMSHSLMAPCLIVALQGEQIVTSLSLILKRIYKEKKSVLEKVGEMIIHPKHEEEAKQLIRYLFDDSSQESRDPTEQ